MAHNVLQYESEARKAFENLALLSPSQPHPSPSGFPLIDTHTHTYIERESIKERGRVERDFHSLPR